MPNTDLLRRALKAAVGLKKLSEMADDYADQNPDDGGDMRLATETASIYYVARRRLVDACIDELEPVLDAVDGTAPTFLERHAVTLENQRMRDELAVKDAKIAMLVGVLKSLVIGGCVSPNGDASLMDRLVAALGGE